MNPQELQKKIAEYYAKLPPKAQEVFSSLGWLESLRSISEKYGLSNAQIETLATETTLVLLGIIHLDEYNKLLTNDLKLSEEIARNVLAEIDETILKTIKPELSSTFEENNKIIENNVHQELDDRFSKLPEDIKKIIQESNYQNTLFAISKKYHLSISQMNSLEKETIFVMLGITPPSEFEIKVIKEVAMGEKESLEITKEINEKIFYSIRESLKMINEKERNEEQGEEGMSLPELHSNSFTQKIQATLEKNPELKPQETENKPQPISVQKLAGTFQVPIKKTDYTLGSLPKNGPSPTSSLAPSPVSSFATPVTPPVTPSIESKPTTDPYREIPE